MAFTVQVFCLVSIICGHFCAKLAENDEASETDFDYIHHDHPATLAIMNNVHKRCPEITRLYNLSEASVQGRALAVIEISENPGKHVASKNFKTMIQRIF